MDAFDIDESAFEEAKLDVDEFAAEELGADEFELDLSLSPEQPVNSVKQSQPIAAIYPTVKIFFAVKNIFDIPLIVRKG